MEACNFMNYYVIFHKQQQHPLSVAIQLFQNFTHALFSKTTIIIDDNQFSNVLSGDIYNA